MKRAIDRGKRSKTPNEVKPVKKQKQESSELPKNKSYTKVSPSFT